jgi:ATP-dependent RNA helicase RhlE
MTEPFANPLTFADFKLNKQLLDAIAAMGYENPTEIQQKAIPLALEGADVLGIAQTGTGKTAAYLLPLLMRIKFAQGDNPRALVLAPTRELAMQIYENLVQLSQNLDLRHACVYGGVGIQAQIKQVQAGIDVLVATPGRFMDIYLRGELVLKDLKMLVLDEADKMMDMGFMPQIRRMLEIIPRKRQNLLFSATFPEKVEKFSEEFLEFPVRVEVAQQATAAETVTQLLYEVPNLKTKINLLEMLLQNPDLSRVIVFCRSRQSAENTFKYLERKFLEDEIRVIHANKGQNTRINSIEAFREGKVKVLVATDVAARGIDVSLVSHVINFDVPLIYEDYVHRIGRTGRAKNEGIAITFMTMAEAYHIQKIEAIIRQTIPRKKLPAGLDIEETPFEEKQVMKLEIDGQKRKADPEYKGAFHDKKKKNDRPKIQKRTHKKFKNS